MKINKDPPSKLKVCILNLISLNILIKGGRRNQES
jgi:hypothetical protein